MRRLSFQALRWGIPMSSRFGDKLQLRKNGLFELHAQPMGRFFNYTEGNHATRLQAWAYCTAVGTTPTPTGGVIEVPLAQTGEGIADCELLKWFVQEGDQVEEFQPLCQVQSDKATIDITSRYKGKVSKVNAMPGAVVKVGETLLELITTGHEPQSNENSSAKTDNDKVLATPAVRKLAKELGMNLAGVYGTGQDGRVLKEDVLKLASAKQGIEEDISSISAPPPEPSQVKSSDEKVVKSRRSAPLQEDEVIPLRGFRRTMAKSMTAAAAVPHFHYMEEITMDSLVKLKASLQAQSSSKLTYLPFLIKALSLALGKHRLMNSTVNSDASVITSKASHNIGVAMATSGGLVVPNIKQVQNLSVFEIAEEITRLSDLAFKNKLSPTDVTDGTITISNFGAIGGKFGSPVLNIPEVSIVAIGRIQQLPRFDSQGRVYSASIASITCGADHRVIDGASVASFCNEWKFLVENPHQWLLHLR